LDFLRASASKVSGYLFHRRPLLDLLVRNHGNSGLWLPLSLYSQLGAKL
jgi:hypothetical protein